MARRSNRAHQVTKNQDYCGQSIPSPVYSVGKDGGLQNVEVYLKGITKGKALSTDTISLVNEHCMFVPRMQGANVGQQIKISSNDPVLHSTHPQNASTNATIYNIALPYKGFSVTKPLPAIPELIKVKCDRTNGCTRGFGSSTIPTSRRLGMTGTSRSRDVPPGTYTLVAWHEAAGEKPISVTVSAGKTTTVAIELAATKTP